MTKQLTTAKVSTLCQYCREPFAPAYKWQIYCSVGCRSSRSNDQIQKWRRENPEQYAKSRKKYRDMTFEQQQNLLDTAKKYRRSIRGKLTMLNLHVKHRGQSNKTIDYKDFYAKFGSREHCCEYCSTKDDLTFDHIIPFSLGGEHTIENLQILCRSCNSTKGNYERWSMV